MSGAVLVAIAATIGNLLQGWDNATIAGNFSISSASNYFIWFTETSTCLQVTHASAYPKNDLQNRPTSNFCLISVFHTWF